jgi:hypothetical protein
VESALMLHCRSPSVCFVHLLRLFSILLYFIFPCVIQKPHICKIYWKEHHPITFIFPSKCIFLMLHSFHYRASTALKMDSFQNLNLISLFQVYQRNWASHLPCLKKGYYSYFIDHYYLLVFYTTMKSYLHLCFMVGLL